MFSEKDAVIIDAEESHQISVIWLHGLGADGHDFEDIVPALNPGAAGRIRFIFPNAPVRPVSINNGLRMRAWYDIKSPDLREMEDAKSIKASADLIGRYIRAETDAGIPPEKTVLAGFSQGGAIALHTGLRYPERLAGIIALSSYLPLPGRLEEEAAAANKNTPVFMAHGVTDPVIPLEQGRDSSMMLKRKGYLVEWNEYPMEHAVCPSEVSAIGVWINGILR